MTDIAETSSSREIVAQHIYFASIYFVIVGILYLWGYWMTFDISILDHLALTDVIKATAYPISLAVALLVLNSLISDKFRT